MVDEIREVHHHDSEEYSGANSMWIAVAMLVLGLLLVLTLFGSGIFNPTTNRNNPGVDIRTNVPAPNTGGNGSSSSSQ